MKQINTMSLHIQINGVIVIIKNYWKFNKKMYPQINSKENNK